MKTTVLRTYRSLLRTSRVLFAGDASNLLLAQRSIRDSFYANRDETDPVKISEQVKAATDAVEFARSNVVQGSLTDRGHYSVKIESEHVDSLNKNPSVRPATKTALVESEDSSDAGGCCGGKS